MLKKFLYTCLVLPFCIVIPSLPISSSELEKINNESLINQNRNTIFITFNEIPNLIIENNLQLKSLRELKNSASLNLSSKISKRYPSLDLNANGLPQYLYGRNFNSNSANTKSSQFSINPSLIIKWDLIDPQRGLEIKSAKENYEIAQNNYEIKKRDLIKEARLRFHELQKSFEEIKNSEISLNLSLQSLKDAESKFEAGIGTKFDVLEATAQLARDQQNLEERKIAHQINKISLREILNINKDIEIEQSQTLLGYWNHSLDKNILSGIENSLSLKNITLQRLIKENQANTFKKNNQPKIYISNTLSSSFTRGDSLSQNIDPNESGSSYSNTISLNFSWRIFNGGQNNKSYKSKQAESNAELYEYKNLKNILEKNIFEAYLNLQKHQKQLLSTREEIASTSESLRLARLRYEVGISTLKDVLLIQKELSNARTKNIVAIYNYNLSLDRLERLTFLNASNECIRRDSDKKDQINSICDY